MNANDELTPAPVTSHEDDPEKIRADIERTRAQMGETMGAIQYKLRPEELKSQAAHQLNDVKERLKGELREQFDELKGKVKEEIRDAKDALREATVGKVETMVHNATDAAENARDSFLETVRANPVPVALVGVGVAWLLMSRRNARALPRVGYRYVEGDEGHGRLGRLQERTAQVAHQVQNAVGGAVHQAGDRTREVAHQVGDRTKDVAHRAHDAASDLALRARGTADGLAGRARYGVHRAEDRVQSAYEANPLALGAVALIAGVAVGLSLPRMQRENRLMGRPRNELLRRAQEAAHETIGRAQGVVAETLQNGVVRENHVNHSGAKSV